VRGLAKIVTLSLNDRAQELADGLAAEGDALRLTVTTLPGGTRLIDCGSAAPGGLEAGRRFAQICMAGLGSVSFAPLVFQGRWLPGLTVVTDRPALACLASQYAGWRLDREGYFAMASGPGRALIRAEELYNDLEVDERARTAVLCLEARDPLPEPVAGYVAERAGVSTADLTLLFAPTASLAGGVQVAARVVETALHKLHELEFDVGRVVSGFGSCPLPPVARTDPEAIGRTNDAVLYGGQVELAVDAPDDELEAIVPRLPSSASRDYGEPFGSVLERAGWDFYEIDPLLFSPAEVRLTSVSSGRSFHAGGVDIDVLERSFRG
jgi:methenyltetrahydromethanopterin cyclohydrolase